MSVWKKNRLLLMVYFLMAVMILAVVLLFDKANIHIFINRHHNSLFDLFFKISTNLGDGIFVIVVSLLLAFWKFRYAVYSVAVYLFSGIFVQLSKRIIWPLAPRPSSFFEEGTLHIVEGIKIYHNHSFPSGHTASAFGLFFALAFLVKNNMLKWIFFLLAWITGFSRIYLSQHFLEDVLAGSIIGVISAILLFIWFERFQAKWIEKSIMNINGI